MNEKTSQELAERFDAIIKERVALQSKIDGLMKKIAEIENEKADLNKEIETLTEAYAEAKRRERTNNG